jgi:hypothetical protein
MAQPFVSIYNYLTTAQIADVQAGTETMDLTAALNTAFNSGNFIDAPSGIYRHDGQLTLPAIRNFALRGEGANTQFKAGAPMYCQMTKATVAGGANNSPVFIDNVWLNANRKADWSLRIGTSKGGRLHNVRATSWLAGGSHFGNEDGTTVAAYYGNELTACTMDGDINFYPASSPAYGFLFNDGATDNVVVMPVASYLDTATGIGIENKGAANRFFGSHVFCAAYGIRASVFCQVVAAYSDTLSVAGIKITSDGVIVDGGQYYWPAGGTPAVGGAVPIEIADGVAVVSIEGGMVRGDNTANPYVRCLGARPARFNCNGLTPARVPQTNLTGDRVAHLWENSIGVRAPTAYMVAAFDLAGPISGKAQFQFAKNDVLRYTFGTDTTDATGIGDANENFEMWAKRDDGSMFQMFKWYRGTKSWFFYDSMMLGGTAGNLGFYGKAPIAKQTGTPANATDLASAIALVNALRTKIIALGLIA